jgi:hypothetical protein
MKTAKKINNVLDQIFEERIESLDDWEIETMGDARNMLRELHDKLKVELNK